MDSCVEVVSYNILSPALTDPKYFPYLDDSMLDADNRFKVIRSELMQYTANEAIICIQEVDHTWFGDLTQLFEQEGYAFVPVTYAVVLGVSIAFPRSRYSLEKVKCQRISRLIPDIDWEDLNPRKCVGVSSRKTLTESIITAQRCANVALQLHLAVKDTGAKFAVTTYHMPCKFRQPQIMAIHCSTLFSWAHETAGDLPHVVAGDFNIKPSDACYTLITEGHITAKDPAVLVTPQVAFNKIPRPMRSALKLHHGAEPEFTNWTHEFRGTLDYVFISDAWEVLSANTPDELTFGPYPSEENGSDHMPISATVRFAVQ